MTRAVELTNLAGVLRTESERRAWDPQRFAGTSARLVYEFDEVAALNRAAAVLEKQARLLDRQEKHRERHRSNRSTRPR